MLTKTTKRVTIKARVFRVATGKWENLGIVYQIKEKIKNLRRIIMN